MTALTTFLLMSRKLKFPVFFIKQENHLHRSTIIVLTDLVKLHLEAQKSGWLAGMLIVLIKQPKIEYMIQQLNKEKAYEINVMVYLQPGE